MPSLVALYPTLNASATGGRRLEVFKAAVVKSINTLPLGSAASIEDVHAYDAGEVLVASVYIRGQQSALQTQLLQSAAAMEVAVGAADNSSFYNDPSLSMSLATVTDGAHAAIVTWGSVSSTSPPASPPVSPPMSPPPPPLLTATIRTEFALTNAADTAKASDPAQAAGLLNALRRPCRRRRRRRRLF